MAVCRLCVCVHEVTCLWDVCWYVVVCRLCVCVHDVLVCGMFVGMWLYVVYVCACMVYLSVGCLVVNVFLKRVHELV